jgi:hypothetical protein
VQQATIPIRARIERAMKEVSRIGFFFFFFLDDCAMGIEENFTPRYRSDAWGVWFS